MKTYVVTISEHSEKKYEVRAKSPAQAEKLVFSGKGQLVDDETMDRNVDQIERAEGDR